PGTVYQFGAWAASAHPSAPANIQFFVNGTMIGQNLQLTSNVGQWQFLSAPWTADTTTAIVEIRNFVDAYIGNDFALDDISFVATDTFEPGLAGWTIYFDLNHDGFLDGSEPFTTTDAN